MSRGRRRDAPFELEKKVVFDRAPPFIENLNRRARGTAETKPTTSRHRRGFRDKVSPHKVRVVKRSQSDSHRLAS